MGNEQKMRKQNQRLLNQKMEQKFKTAFSAVIVGVVIVVILALLNIMIYAKLAGVGVFSTFSRAVGMILLILSVLLTISLISVVSKSLTNALVEPIYELQDAIRKMKDGRFDADIKYEGKDELGELVEDLKDACGHVHMVLTDAGYVLGEMAEGNFNISSKAEECYVGDFHALILGMRKLNRQLDDTLHEIRTSSQQVMIGADQLASSAQDLAEGATNQASAVEELAATVENVINISIESANNADYAATSVTAAAEDAKKSREEVNQLTDAMERIIETSKQIEDIIGAIEDIADQTNLLSLNASIEAARAGEAGRGFAVVADQIGKLASDSAQSAVTTKELIGKCLAEVEAGNRIVGNTMEAINEVLVNMESFAGMAIGSAEASKTQVNMLKEVGEGINQITSVVQSNSAAAQETSAVSEELSAQATGLEGMVEHFVLRENV
ncbi:MAG: HAMP domain-containing protein [Agathobacter sp.]|nr:HAMP domain-containing protein [Agathobacter sp.]